MRSALLGHYASQLVGGKRGRGEREAAHQRTRRQEIDLSDVSMELSEQPDDSGIFDVSRPHMAISYIQRVLRSEKSTCGLSKFVACVDERGSSWLLNFLSAEFPKQVLQAGGLRQLIGFALESILQPDENPDDDEELVLPPLEDETPVSNGEDEPVDETVAALPAKLTNLFPKQQSKLQHVHAPPPPSLLPPCPDQV